MSITVSKLLKEAISIMKTRGVCAGNFMNFDGQVCAHGALNLAYRNLSDKKKERSDLTDYQAAHMIPEENVDVYYSAIRKVVKANNICGVLDPFPWLANWANNLIRNHRGQEVIDGFRKALHEVV